MAVGTVGTARVVFEADTSALSEQLLSKMDEALSKIDQVLATLTGKATQHSGEAAHAIEDNFRTAANQAAQSLDSIDGDSLTRVSTAADHAGERISSGIGGGAQAAATTTSTAATSASRSLSGISGAAARSGQQTSASIGAGMRGVTSAAASAAQAAGTHLGGIGRFARGAATQAAHAFNGVRSTISNAFSRAGTAAATAGHAIRTQLTQPLTESEHAALRIPTAVGRIGGALAAIAGPAAVLKGGFDRLMNIQRAEIMFKSVGLTAEQTKTQMSRLTEQVTGTSVSLADAAKYSAMFAQSGVEMGKPMDDTIQAFTSLSAIAEGSGVDVGRVLQQISAQGKVTGEDIMQMSDAGVNATKYLADSMGMSQEEVKKAISDGKVSFEDFVNAVNLGTGDLAKQMGQTLPAKISILKTALSNLGAAIIEPFIPGITAAVEFGTALIKGAVAPLQAFITWLKSGSIAADLLKGAIIGVAGVMAAGFLFNILKAVQVTTMLTNAMKVLNLSFVTSPIGILIASIGGLVAAFTVLWNHSEGFRAFWVGLWQQVQTAVGGAVDGIRGKWEAFTGWFSTAVQGVRDLIVGGDFTGALHEAFGIEEDSPIISGLLTIRGHLMELPGLARGVADILFRGDYTGLPFGIEEDSTIVDILFTVRDTALTAWDAITKIGDAFANVGSAIGSAAWSVIVSVFQSIATVGRAVWDALVSIGHAVWQLIQALAPVLLPVLKAIGSIIGGVLLGAIGLLVGALLAVSKVVGVVANVISWLMTNVLSPLITVIGEVVTWLVDHLAGAFTWVAEKISAFIEWLSPTMSTVWDGIKQAWSGAIDFLGNLFSGIWGFIQAAWDTVGKPVIDVIVNAFLLGFGLIVLAVRKLGDIWDWVWQHLQAAWDAVGQPVVDFVVQAFHTWWSGMQVIFGWVKTGWDVLWAGVRWVYDTVISPVLAWIGARFAEMRDAIGRALDRVQGVIHHTGEVIRSLWDRYVQPMVDWVVGGFQRVVDAVRRLKDRVIGAVSDAGRWLWNAGKQVVQGMIDGVSNMVSPLIDKVKGLASSAINAAKDVLGIHSPSTVFRKFGENIGQGLAQGITASKAMAARAAQDLGSAVQSVPMPTIDMDTNLHPTMGGSRTRGKTHNAATMPHPDYADGLEKATPAVLAMGDTAQMVNEQLWGPAMLGMQASSATTGMETMLVSYEQVTPALMSMGATADVVTTTQWQPSMIGMQQSALATGAVTANTASMVLNPALWSVGVTAWNVHNGSVNPALAAMRGALQVTSNAFGVAATNIAVQWNRVREATAAPVRFAIHSVFNDGIVGMWNSVSDLLGTQRMAAYPVRFATGGVVSGPGGPTGDKIPALLSDGEYVITADAVKRIGVKNLHALNYGKVAVADGAFRTTRQQNTLFNDATFTRMASRYAGGGIVKGSKEWNQLRRGYVWAQQLSGRPYVLGGDPVGGGGTDCSGYMSSIADRIQGGPGHRRWATMAFNGGGNTQYASGPQGFVKGLAAGFSIGVTNGGAAGGHTAGTIGGVEGLPAVNVESGGSPSRVKFGAGAVGADDSYFRTHYHLPYIAGGGFVSGGVGGPSLAEIVASMMKPFRDKARSEAAAWQRTHPGIINTYPVRLEKTLGDATQKRVDTLLDDIMVDPGGSGVSRWAPMVRRALAHTGFPVTDKNVRLMLAQIQTESGGNPGVAQSITDINGTGENAGVGLLQIIPGTFAAYRDPSLPNDRRNPYANMVAALRYYQSRYGMDLSRMWGRGHGYDLGGVMRGAGLFTKFTTQPERVLSPRQTKSFDRLVEWLDAAPNPTIQAGGGTRGSYDERTVRRVEVTQNIHTSDPRVAADQVSDRLMALMV